MSDLRWSKYILPNNREVYLTQRPDVATESSIADFIQTQKPLVRFQFTDDYVERPKNDPPVHWYPWVPGKSIPIECVFAFNSLMDRYVHALEDGAIWLHCDSSSMRAPTYFGLYLAAYYPDQLDDICAKMTVHPTVDYNYALHSRADKYLEISLRLDTDMQGLIEAYKRGGDNEAHQYYMLHRKEGL